MCGVCKIINRRTKSFETSLTLLGSRPANKKKLLSTLIFRHKKKQNILIENFYVTLAKKNRKLLGDKRFAKICNYIPI